MSSVYGETERDGADRCDVIGVACSRALGRQQWTTDLRRTQVLTKAWKGSQKYRVAKKSKPLSWIIIKSY